MRNALLVIGVLGLVAGVVAEEKAISFEVTSVKVNKSDDPPHAGFPMGPGDVYVANGGRFTTSGFSLATYLFFAYKIMGNDSAAVSAQLPGWASSDRFDIEARTDGDSAKDTKDQMRLMMRSLLADRFKLGAHYETKQVSVFGATLVKPGKTGAQLQPHSVSEAESPCTTVLSRGTSEIGDTTVTGGFPTQCGGLLGMPPGATGRIKVGARNITMQFLANLMTAMGDLGRAVIDQTGLTGTFDFTLEYVPDSVANAPVGSSFVPDPNGPSFQQALKDQLGLKLDSQKGSTEVLIIDHVERPSEN